MQTVVVAGDLIWDLHLVQHNVDPAISPKQLKNPILSATPGGAWYLGNMVQLACSDIKGDLNVLSVSPKSQDKSGKDSSINQSYSLWSRYSSSHDSPSKQVWRVERFLGTQAPDEGVQNVSIEGDVRNPHLLVIDDLGGSFRFTKALWPLALGDQGSPGAIILKTQAPLGEGDLWDTLIKKYRNILTVVISVAALRARDAQISQGLSWDKAIGEIVNELSNGPSARDLASCRSVVVHFNEAGAAIFTRCPLRVDEGGARCNREPDNTGKKLLSRIRLDRFVYHPIELEAMSRSRFPGVSFGATAIMTAAVARHQLHPESCPLPIAIKRGLEAVLVNHIIGGGEDNFSVNAPDQKIQNTFNPSDPEGSKHEPGLWPYCSAFPHALLSDPRLRAQPEDKPDLLQDFTGAGYEYVATVAADVVRRGWEKALQPAPKALYGQYVTVDSEEIEDINLVRSKIEGYRRNETARTPLSFAVFGPPGSGKSFAVSELSKELLKEKKKIIEHLILKFNLTQIHSVDMLHEKFHKVRTASILDEIPIVFWDEFDTEDLKWLKYFLAPMQDGEFESSTGRYPLGKAIFIFAGGTADSFKHFDKTRLQGAEGKRFRSNKGPDFVSRLQGSIDIKGPNPVGSVDLDVAHLVRRAVLLRSSLERFQPRVIDPATKEAMVSPGVLRAFLRVKSFEHGARSLESIVRMSTLSGEYFGKNALPSEVVERHASDDFFRLIEEGEMEASVVEALAAATHEAWRQERKRQGTSAANVLSVAYANLSEFNKELNRKTARFTYAKLLDVGVSVVRHKPTARRGHINRSQFNRVLPKLMQIEHDIWLRDHLLRGYDWSSRRNDQLLLHRDVTTFAKTPAEDQAYDRVIAESVYDGLAKFGYALVKARPAKNG